VQRSNEFIARKREEDGAKQTILEHLNNTAEHASRFADDFGCGQLAYDIARIHDVGKYSSRFQQRVQGANFSVDHSTPGGQLIRKNNRNALGMIAAYCIMGHHGGLPNGGSTLDTSDNSTLHGCLKRDVEDCSSYASELSLPHLEPPNLSIEDGFGAAFLIRMLFSSLVDADSLDAEAFTQGEKPRGGTNDLIGLKDKLFAEIDGFLHPSEPVSELNAKRTKLLKNCLSSSENESGLFTLTAPTGSGKTVASMAFALNHAAKYGKSRIIYVVPYNTIIEQNSKVFEDILGSENVLQHHSNIHYDDTSEESLRKSLATENWDYPIVVTSSVQFFQSLFGNRRSSCRKLHNVANSVIIFDEAQMIPVNQLFYNKGYEALDIKQIVPKLDEASKSFAFPFREIAEEFQIIEEDAGSAYVLHKAPELEKRLYNGERSRELFRELGQYSISLYQSNLRKLLDIGAVIRVDGTDDGVLILLEKYYDENCGVMLSSEGGHALMLPE